MLERSLHVQGTAAALLPGLKQTPATASFRLGRFTVPGCAPILGAGTGCDANHDIVFGFLKSSHPDVVLLHAMWDRTHNLERLWATIEQLKALKIRRIVVLGPAPPWKRTLPMAMMNTYRLTHVIADRIAAGVTGAGARRADAGVQPSPWRRIRLGLARALRPRRLRDAGQSDGAGRDHHRHRSSIQCRLNIASRQNLGEALSAKKVTSLFRME